MIIEHRTFTLADGVGEEAFLAADRRAQQEFAPFQPGFLRRTTARGDNGTWLIETLWATDDDARSAERSAHPAVEELRSMMAPGSESCARYETLD